MGYVAVAIVIGMLVAGSASTLLSKYQDRLCLDQCSSSNPVYFSQPLIQTWIMFLGEALCFIAYLLTEAKQQHQRNVITPEEEQQLLRIKSATPIPEHAPLPLRGCSYLMLTIPVACDLTATTLISIGLLAVSASIYQMSRGTVVIFTAILSVTVLKKTISRSRQFGLLMVLLGVALVGASPLLFPADGNAEQQDNSTVTSPFVGVLLILLAQAFTAVQFTFEESLMNKYQISPLKLVGIEGVIGSLLISILLLICALVPALGRANALFDVYTGTKQLFSSTGLVLSSVGTMIAIAFLNWFGQNITKYISATSRSTVDTCRTLIIWVISLGLKWERFLFIQVIGFLMLVYGTFVFNKVIPILPCWSGTTTSHSKKDSVDEAEGRQAEERYKEQRNNSH